MIINASGLTVNLSENYYIYDLSSTDNKVIDVFNCYSLLFISILAFISQVLCSIIFLNKELFLSGNLFKFLFTISVNGIIGAICCFIFVLSRCSSFENNFQYTYASKFLEFWIFSLLGNTLYFLYGIQQFLVSLNQYLSLLQRSKKFTDRPWQQMFYAFIIAIIYYLPHDFV